MQAFSPVPNFCRLVSIRLVCLLTVDFNKSAIIFLEHFFLINDCIKLVCFGEISCPSAQCILEKYLSRLAWVEKSTTTYLG